MESVSAAFLGAYGATSGWTPNIDQLAREGIKFERVFATGTRTVRGLEALSLGTPPVPGQAIVRRPNNEHLATIGEILKLQNYSTFFFYGGYGYFDNMNAYYSGNNYQVIDRTDFPEESVMFENAWGVADEALFDNTFATLDKEFQHNRPFFAQIMTTSNHRP
ncbi:MAG: sulfatase-like hydrolase/transferase, partial [Candidatus Nitrotoga sp.]